jgi:hypothetical protein
MTDVVSAGSSDELERLRLLVGPSEVDYASLRAGRDAAQEVAKQAMAESGELSGRLEEMSVQLSRARQDQDVLLLRAEMGSWQRIVDRVRRRWATSVTPRVSGLVGRLRSS